MIPLEDDDRVELGDFSVRRAALRRAERRHGDRNRAAAAVDERLRAPITTDVDLWSDDPGLWDYPGVDTPSDAPRERAEDNLDRRAARDRARDEGRLPVDDPPDSLIDDLAFDKTIHDIRALFDPDVRLGLERET